jgi:hypothetical protein
MASENKKRKCRNTSLDRGGEKGKLFKLKREAMYHKKDRKHNKKICEESEDAE